MRQPRKQCTSGSTPARPPRKDRAATSGRPGRRWAWTRGNDSRRDHAAPTPRSARAWAVPRSGRRSREMNISGASLARACQVRATRDPSRSAWAPAMRATNRAPGPSLARHRSWVNETSSRDQCAGAFRVRSRSVVGMTPEEIADLAHLRRARDPMDRDHAQPPSMSRRWRAPRSCRRRTARRPTATS